MATNFTEMLPQQRGVIMANEQANKFPDGSAEQEELLKIRDAGLDLLEAMEAPNNGQFSPQGRVNSKKKENYLAKNMQKKWLNKCLKLEELRRKSVRLWRRFWDLMTEKVKII